MVFHDDDRFNKPGSGILDPVEHSVVEESWGAIFTREDGPALLKQMGAIPIAEIIHRETR